MFFETNSLRNTTLAVKDDVLYYEIVTRFWHPNVTRIIKHDFESRVLTPVAEIEGLFDKKSRVRFGPFAAEDKEPEWTPADEFVKFDKERGGSFILGEGKEYQWKIVKGNLHLVKTDEPDKTLVEFHPYKRHFGLWRMSQHAYFEIKPEQEIIEAFEKFIVTYLLVERRRRDRPVRFKRTGILARRTLITYH